MDRARIMVVEDEGIIAQDIKNCLENLGYEVPDVVFTGKEAIEKAEENHPDLILMDIVLKGEMDGIETASEIRNRFSIPIVYLTAYEDDKTLKRAKLTEPLGYILKPFEERSLRSSIEMALYKHKMELKLRESERWLSTILRSVGDAVVVTDALGYIRFMNPVAETLTGWSFKDAFGKNLKEIFNIVNEDTKKPVENPVARVLQNNIVLGRNNHSVLISRTGDEISIDHSAAPIRDEKGNVTGVVLIINDISDRRIAENALRESENRYRNLFDFATDAIFVQSLQGSIISVNNEACRLLDYSREEFYRLNFDDLLYTQKTEPGKEIIGIVKQKGSHRFESQYKRKDGTLVDVEVSMRLIGLLEEDVIQSFVRDITERKQSQKEINMLAHAVKSISECVSITDLQNRLIFVNEAFVKTYGYKPEELSGKSLNIIRSQKNPPGLYEEIDRETLRGGWQGELFNRTRDGVEFPIYLSTSVVRNEAGETVAFIGVANDITERKRLEDALRSSEKDYKGLFENAHDAIIIYRPDDEIILDINTRACEIYGYSRAEFIGMGLENITADVSKTRKNIKAIVKDGSRQRYEMAHRKKDGTKMSLEINAAVVNYKGQRAIMSINRDITDRKKAVEALLESEKRYQDLYDSAPDIYFSVSSEGIIKSVNEFGAGYLGYTNEELFGRNFFDIVHTGDRQFLRQKLENIFYGRNNNHTELEFRILKKDGSSIWVRERTRLILDENGKPKELFIISRDVTERKRTEEILKEREELYRSMFEKNQAVKLLVDPDSGAVVDANIAACVFYGTDIDALRKMNFKEISTLPESEISRELQRAKNEENSYFILQNKISSGEIRDVEVYTGPIDVKGRKLLFCIIHDITERRRAEAALVESEQKYKNLAEFAPIAVTRIVTPSNYYDFVNDEFVRQSGYTMEEFNKLTDKKLIDMIYEEDREKVFSFYREWRNQDHKGTQQIDYRIINRYNKVVWLDTYLYADFNPDGSLKAINQICIDVTEQRRAQAGLRESERRFRAMIENSTDLIALIDEKGNILYASPSTTRILGYELEDYVGKNGFDFMHPDDKHATAEMLSKLLKNPGMTISTQYRTRHKDGRWLWIEASGTNLMDEPTIGAIVVNYRDITERKRAEEEIMLQKSYFQQLFENSPEAVVILDNADRVVNINKGFEKMFHYSLDEIRGKNINSLLVPENLSEQATQISLFVLKGEVIHKESVRKRKDGSLVDVSILGYPITLGNDQIGVYGIYNDITERKETEKALRNSEERYRAFVQQSSEGILRFEFLEPIPVRVPVTEQIKHTFRYGFLAECNDNLARMRGFSSAEKIVGLRLSEFLPESEPGNVEYIRKFIESGYRLTDTESHMVDSDGNRKFFLSSLVGIVEDDKVIRAWGTQKDITQTKIADEELSKIQFRLATLLSNLPDVVLYETGGGKEFYSENVIDLLGYPASKFTANPQFFNSIIHPGDYKVLEGKIKAWEAAGKPGILNTEFRCRRADGTYIWIEDHMVSVKIDEGPENMAGVLINVTEHKGTEEKLKMLAEKLSVSNKELEQFAYVASHDLQEPLRMVASYIQLLQRRYKGQISKEADEFIGFAVDGVVRMKTLINDLLIYSRVNTREFPAEPTDINKIIEQVKVNLKTAIEEADAVIEYENLPTVNCSPLQITQLFQNLISNAIKFRSDERPPRVQITAKLTDDEWMFSVADNGIGIEKEYTERVFVIFQRLHNYNEYPGTGIGLAICKKIVEKFGGHIWVESEPGKGSTFNFTVPIIEEGF
jgi:PAS domain S-box-containing protein